MKNLEILGNGLIRSEGNRRRFDYIKTLAKLGKLWIEAAREKVKDGAMTGINFISWERNFWRVIMQVIFSGCLLLCRNLYESATYLIFLIGFSSFLYAYFWIMSNYYDDIYEDGRGREIERRLRRNKIWKKKKKEAKNE